MQHLREPGERQRAIAHSQEIVVACIDPTVNLHEWYVGVRNGVVETLWPIAGRGAIACPAAAGPGWGGATDNQSFSADPPRSVRRSTCDASMSAPR